MFNDTILALYITHLVKGMRGYVHDTQIYRDFPTTKIRIHSDMTGCQGGIKTVCGVVVPYMEISTPYITDYTLTGFVEYTHICNDEEIGSIPKPCSWRHTVAAVICHEFAHSIDMMHENYKVHGHTIPEMFNTWSVDLIEESYSIQKQYHGARWQFVYRTLRNEFVNRKPKEFWNEG